MEILILVIALLVVAGAATAVVVTRKRRHERLEPPARRKPTGRPTGSAAPPVEEASAPPAEADVEAPPGPTAEPAVDEELAQAVDEALAPVLEPEAPPAPPARPRFRDRLGKARSTLAGYMGSLVGRTKIDEETWDELEEALIRADVGVGPTQDLLDHLRARVKAEGLTDGAQLVEALKAELKERLAGHDLSLHVGESAPSVWLFVGVNGVGKTTTIGKLGTREVAAGRSVMMAAGDTFRAAAAEQLALWAERAGADVVRGNEGGDPSAVIFDAIESAASKGTDLVLADTAGRLHTKVNLMEELRKVRRVAEKGDGTVTEVLLVLDATTGQNGLVQARQFTEAVELTGVVLTKLDGSAKGGIVVAIQSELGIPVKLVGLGEGAEDLVAFDADEFVEALFS